MPSTVYFRGQTAPLQARNSGGVRFQNGDQFLAALVDASGYTSAVRERYQGYLLSDGAVMLGGHRLEPGAYGFGFLDGDRLLVMDLGAHELFTVISHRDGDLRRPTPLQVVAGRLAAAAQAIGVPQAAV